MDAKLKRNIVLVGHAHCGKTSLTEGLLFAGGAISRKGDVTKGSTVSDFQDDEIERRISINASFSKITFKNHQIQIIDTPGYADFIGEMISAIRVTDAAVVVIDAVKGVEIGTEDVWERLESTKMPRIIFVNKVDKEGANPQEAISSIKADLSKKATVVDLNSTDLIETVAESDDQLLEKYLESGSLSPQEVEGALRKAVLEGKIFPIIQGSALTDAGVKELLEMIVSYFPSTVERPAFKAKGDSPDETKEIAPSADGLFAGFVFKSIFDPHLGQLSLMRILRGKLNSNSDCFNATASSKEHVSTISVLQGKEQTLVNEASCGDIIALPKLKNTHTGDTLTDPKDKFSLEAIIFPEPSISASVKPKTRSDEEKISTSLHRLCEEDSTFRVSRDNETKELIVSGIGDLHLKVMLDRMKQRYHVDVELGTPKVAYRETITKPATARHKYKKQSGGRGQYGDVELEIAPLNEEGKTYEFVNKIFGGAIPRNYIPSVEKGVKQVISEGALSGSLIINLQVSVTDGSYHTVDSSDMAFQIAGAMALRDAIKLAAPVLLEPIMEVTIVVPDEFIGQISGDISSRRGRLMGSEAKGRNQVLKAQVPLGEMFKYATDLRSMTGGRGSYSMKFTRYEQAPAKVTAQVIAQKQAEKEKSQK